jgi:hypothetical protein
MTAVKIICTGIVAEFPTSWSVHCDRAYREKEQSGSKNFTALETVSKFVHSALAYIRM